MNYLLRQVTENGTVPIRVTSSEFYIGTSAESDFVLDSSKANRSLSVLLTVTDKNVQIESVQYNNLRLNGKKTRKSIAVVGDVISIENIRFIFDVEINKPADNSKQNTNDGGTRFAELLEFCKSVGEERDMRNLLKRIITNLLGSIGGNSAFIFTLDSAGKPEVFISSNNEGSTKLFSDTIVQAVMKSGKGMCIGNTLMQKRFNNAQSIADLKLSSVLCTPIKVAEKITGVIYLGAKDALTSFKEEDLEILTVYASIVGMLQNHVEYISQQNEIIKKLSSMEDHSGFIAQSEIMIKVKNDINAVSGSEISVLLNGETGVGKDVVARLIHQKSARRDSPFIAVNCSSLRGELLDSELFGHKKGAFTGATADHNGLFSAADSGVLFLDEIGEMGIGLQAKLLRTLESGLIRPVGATEEKAIDVRIICATNRNLDEMVQNGSFREDLFFRLNQFQITIPPLRDRSDDILYIAYHLLDVYRKKYPTKEIVDFHPEDIHLMQLYEWPGNVRELSNVIHKAVITSNEPLIRFDSLSEKNLSFDYDASVGDFQRRLIVKALSSSDGNREQAAKLLGMSRSTLFRHLSSLHIK